MNDRHMAADGPHTDNGVPKGCTSITPFLAVHDPEAAVEFYRRVFGAEQISRIVAGGRIVHAELAFERGRLQLGPANPAFGLVAPNPEEDLVSCSLVHYCPDVDATVRRALDAGAVLREPVTDFVSGDRFGSVRDPFGVRWAILTRIEDLDDAESAARVERWATGRTRGREEG